MSYPDGRWSEEQKEAFGAETERRFWRAVQIQRANEPKWFAGILIASAVLDFRGVDYIALVQYPGSNRPVMVPVQLKSSGRQANAYLEKNPGAEKAGVCVILVKAADGADTIRAKLFTELGRIRNQGLRFDKYINRLARRRVTAEFALARIDVMRADRAKERGPVPLGEIVFLQPPPLTKIERLQESISWLLAKKLSALFATRA